MMIKYLTLLILLTSSAYASGKGKIYEFIEEEANHFAVSSSIGPETRDDQDIQEDYRWLLFKGHVNQLGTIEPDHLVNMNIPAILSLKKRMEYVLSAIFYYRHTVAPELQNAVVEFEKERSEPVLLRWEREIADQLVREFTFEGVNYTTHPVYAVLSIKTNGEYSMEDVEEYEDTDDDDR